MKPPAPLSTRRVVLAAGGTGGHFFPAEALAAALLARGHEIALLTDARGSAGASAVFAGHPVHVLQGAGIAGRSATEAARASMGLALGSLRARTLLRGLHPSAIVGFGGYPTVAPVMGSRLLRRRVPIILHEQNAVLGRTNRTLARAAAALALSYDPTKGVPDGARTVMTGNPVRPAIAALAGSPYRPPNETSPIRIVVLGGSLGARIFAELVPAALTGLPPPLRARLIVAQQCRAEDMDEVRAAYAGTEIAVDLAPFFNDVATLLDRAHLVLSRAGASSLAELAVIGRPAILVPLPGAIDGHQAANAAALGHGAFLLRQDGATPQALGAQIATLLEKPALLAHAAEVAVTHGRPKAADALADLVEQVLGERRE
jgi:UDP-N-acetylglucosamine--N-acetylmuramyl-(pentapeptide) pyrophosphoryl-undecaprenol N-acetylglucosamine transferase